MKILAIGNSFSVDGMEHIYQVAENLGAKEIVLGNLYIGGCSLERHAGNIENDLPAYEYYFNNSGEWHITKETRVSDVINQYDWDYVSLQQVSGKSGKGETYEPYLTYILDYVHKMLPNTKVMWHMTWAYPKDSDNGSFAGYDPKNRSPPLISIARETSKSATALHYSTCSSALTAIRFAPVSLATNSTARTSSQNALMSTTK